jgi:hypothetical protein
MSEPRVDFGVEAAPTAEAETVSEDAPVMPSESLPGFDAEAGNQRPKHTRSRVTNHEDLLPGLDGRSSAARRFRDLVGAYIADMGGLDQCSEIKLGLLRRLAATTVQAELLEAQMVNGEPVDVATLCTLASTTVRLSTRLGLERVPKDVGGPSLGDMLRADINKRRRRERRRLEATAAAS